MLFYNEYKNKFEFETYLSSLPERTRIPITKFHTNNSKLPIVTGRFVGRNEEITLRENRYCILCDSHDVGGELYLLYKCMHESIVESRRNF